MIGKALGIDNVWQPTCTAHAQAISLWQIGVEHKEEWQGYYPDKVLDVSKISMFMEMMDEDFAAYCNKCAAESHGSEGELKW